MSINMLTRQFRRFFRPFLPCQLCGETTHNSFSLCQDCYDSLPWLKSCIARHEMQIWAVFYYRFPINRIIQQFKYEQHLHFDQLLAESLLTLPLPQVQAIVPMPISTARLQERGYNQMQVIANILSKKLGIPVWNPIIRDAQHSQKDLSRTERLHNLDQQFHVNRHLKIKYRKVLVLDDVVTTGSSLAALKTALQQVGCRHMTYCCLAATME